jgi:isohexenylglutaconyl-CoA hydratase
VGDPTSIAVTRDGPVLHLTLNRPQVRNAMSLAMVREMSDALHSAEGDGNTRVIVLRGADGNFSAGADIKDMAAARARLAEDPGALAKVNSAFGELCGAFSDSGLAIVAVVEGAVMGGGFGLCCVADVVIASGSTMFGLPETSLGVLPAQIAPFLVERLGYSEAKRLAVTGGRLNAQQALAIRLVHEVHEKAGLDAAVARTVGEILACAPGALAATKTLVRKARWSKPSVLVQEAAQAFSHAAIGAEGIEGMGAFLQKRKPRWSPP